MKSEYQTSDLQLAAFLLTKGVKLLRIIETTPFLFTFILSDEEKCLDLEQKYINNAKAPVLDLYKHRDLLISRIKNKDKN